MIEIHTIRKDPLGDEVMMMNRGKGKIPKRYEKVVIINHRLRRSWVGTVSGSGVRKRNGEINYRVIMLKEIEYKEKNHGKK